MPRRVPLVFGVADNGLKVFGPKFKFKAAVVVQDRAGNALLATARSGSVEVPCACSRAREVQRLDVVLTDGPACPKVCARGWVLVAQQGGGMDSLCGVRSNCSTALWWIFLCQRTSGGHVAD